MLHCVVFTDFRDFWNKLLLRFSNLWLNHCSKIYFWLKRFLLRFLNLFFIIIIFEHLSIIILVIFMILDTSWRQLILEVLKIQLIIIRSYGSLLETIIVFPRLFLIKFVLMFIFTRYKRSALNYFILQLSLSFHHLFWSLWTLRGRTWLVVFIIFILVCLVYESKDLSKAIWAKWCHIIERIIVRSFVSILNCEIKPGVCWLSRHCAHFVLVSQKCFLWVFQVFENTDSCHICIIESRFLNFIQVWVWRSFKLT